ncbi:hypothetical protein RFEPED_1411 [Rickettsia felis str. Pedreira]|uniref:Uncharacterized protein n=1 Tax=Rickettsia felis str. Pedreira TaxID=1359196 RepID=A0A0F3MTK1_RICFI|nr:hypothetical protein [Rickettsia felis]KJV59016.1 hypothetical protein RFEPED_1411 [Rickettsia felis str. Pedreira]
MLFILRINRRRHCERTLVSVAISGKIPEIASSTPMASSRNDESSRRRLI